jgi:predicted TIM-barrel fold metal-dependent hydrolase
MDHGGISEALVLDSLSRENHPDDGNRRVLEVAAVSPRLHPVWSALPAYGLDEQADPRAFLDEMRRRRIAALTLFPRQYRFSLSDWCMAPFIEPFAEARVPVFVNFNEVGRGWWDCDQTDWEAVVAFGRRWPTLPVIVSEYRIRRSQRLIYRALDACENLHIELSGYWLHRGIEYIAAHWGAKRLIFGSNWPHLGQHITIATLTTADVSDADKRLIAGDNLRKLIRWCGATETSPAPLPPPADEYARFARTGVRPAGMEFWDNHGHLGGRARDYHLPDCTLEGIVRDMDRLGVRKVCVFGFTGVFSDEQPGNDAVAEAVRRYPDRFVGLTLLNPHRGRDEMIRELERASRMGLRGVKLIPHYQGYPEEDPILDVPCRWAHERRQIILNHYWGSARQMERLVSAYPDACFFTGHATTEYAAIMKKYPNLYVCSCPLTGPRDCEKVVAAIGADRLLFGSDLQDLPIAWGLGPILVARIPAEQKRLILGENLKRILARYSLKP